MVKKAKVKFNFLECSSCNNTGKTDQGKCEKCSGLGMGVLFRDYFLYWGKRVDALQISQDKIKKFVQYVINIALILFGLLGGLALGWRIWQLGEEAILTLPFWQGKNFYLLIFWLSLLTDLYLYYRFTREGEKMTDVLSESVYSEKDMPETPELANWDKVGRLKNSFKIDVAESFSEESMKLLHKGWKLARRLKSKEATPLHLFATILSSKKVAVIFTRLGISFGALKDRVIKSLAKSEKAGETVISSNLRKTLVEAYLEAYFNGKKRVELTEILLPLVKNDQAVQEIMYDLEVSLDKLANAVEWIRINEHLRKKWQESRRLAGFKPKGIMDRAMTAVATPYLDQFSEDLTRLAKAGYLVPCIGREKEIEQIFRDIEGGRKSVVLVGNPGVGKNTILEGLAERMVEERVPLILQDKRLVSLSIPALVSGASPEEAGQRLLNISHEIARAGNIVMVIPNIHEMVGVSGGAGEGKGVDLSEVLVEEVSAGYFFVLSTTTPEKYSKNLEKVSLGTTLQKIIIDEPDKNLAIQILEAKAGTIEYHSRVYFSYDALEKAVDLSDKLIHDHYLPEKAIDIIKEAADYTRKKRGARSIVKGEDVAEIISEETKIPVTKVTEKEADKLLNLEKVMHERIVGQDEAISMVAQALRRARTELRENKRPIANFLFLGPTGVGKTETAKTVAEVYFGSEKSMIRLDMSEYQEKTSLNRLLGNSGEGGLLTEPVRKNPFALLLLDEIEKAHPDILNLFLQVMDDGRATDGAGRLIDFTNIILIGTSNAGTKFIQTEIKKGDSAEQIKKELMEKELDNYFRPEFLNRFDGIIVFKPLLETEIQQIARLLLNGVAKKLEEQRGAVLQFTDAAVEELALAGFDPIFGARPLRRVIQEKVDDTLANLLLQDKVGRRDKIIFDKGGEIKVEKAKVL